MKLISVLSKNFDENTMAKVFGRECYIDGCDCTEKFGSFDAYCNHLLKAHNCKLIHMGTETSLSSETQFYTRASFSYETEVAVTESE